MSGITLALIQFHHARVAALATFKTDAEIAEKLLGSHLGNHPLQFADNRYPARRVVSPNLRLVDDLVDEILHFFGFRFRRRDAFMQNQTPQKSFDKCPTLISSATENAA